MFTYEELSGFLKNYQESLDKYQELTDRLLLPCSHEEWMKILEERSDVIRETFARNEEWFPRIYAEMEHLTLEKANIYYRAFTEFVVTGYTNIDFPLATDILESLVPVFEAEAPIADQIILDSLLVFLYGCYYDTLMGKDNMGFAQSYAEKIVSYRKYYAKLADELEARLNIWRTYINLFGGIAGVSDLSLETLTKRYDEMEDFWNSDVVQKMDGENEKILFCIAHARNAFLSTAYDIARERLKNADKADYRNCLKDIEERLQPLLGDESDPNTVSYYCRCILDIAAGKIDAKELVYQAIEELEEAACDDVAEKTFNEIGMLVDDITARRSFFFGLLDVGDFDEDEKKRLSNRSFRLFLQKMRVIPGAFEKEVVDHVYANLFYDSLPYLDTFREKEEMLEKLIISRQPQTFIHSCMVEKLAVMAAKTILEKNPEIFAGIPEYETVALLRDKKEEFLAYIGKCGTYHDIGKCEIAGVINMQMHKVTDQEFACIKRHPRCGMKVFENDADFAPYIPVILGHHKTYDGTRGYPADFDILSSPYKPVIDLISICDSLDAATDQLGRNYNKAKTFDVVLEEFRQGAGTRYNPDIVKVIEEDAALQEKMRHLVTDGRADAYFEAYRQCQRFAEMTI